MRSLVLDVLVAALALSSKNEFAALPFPAFGSYREERARHELVARWFFSIDNILTFSQLGSGPAAFIAKGCASFRKPWRCPTG